MKTHYKRAHQHVIVKQHMRYTYVWSLYMMMKQTNVRIPVPDIYSIERIYYSSYLGSQ